MGLQMDGLDEFREAFARLRDRGPEVIGTAVRRHMEEDVLPAAQERVPVLTGRLKATGRVEAGQEPHEWVVWFGDSATENDALVDYAAAVHERDARHAPPTGVKFVEDPLKESVERLAHRAAHALDDLASP